MQNSATQNNNSRAYSRSVHLLGELILFVLWCNKSFFNDDLFSFLICADYSNCILIIFYLWWFPGFLCLSLFLLLLFYTSSSFLVFNIFCSQFIYFFFFYFYFRGQVLSSPILIKSAIRGWQTHFYFVYRYLFARPLRSLWYFSFSTVTWLWLTETTKKKKKFSKTTKINKKIQ